MTQTDRTDCFEVFIAGVIFLLVFFTGKAILEESPKLEESNPCPKSHEVISDGVFVGCTGDSTHYRGVLPHD